MSSPPPEPPAAGYRARRAYQAEAAGAAYGEPAGTGGGGPLGRYRRAAERRAVAALAAGIPDGATVLDCPCGNGRWLGALAARAGRIVGLDVSRAMLARARERARALPVESAFLLGEAERLPLADGSVDIAFCFALTKHLPWPVQGRVLAELGRVSRTGVICSFAVPGPVSYALWRRRGLVESFPVLREQLAFMAGEAGLAVTRIERCSTPLGVERLVRFDRT